MYKAKKMTYENCSGIENHALERTIFNILPIVSDMNFPFSSFLRLKWGVKGAIFFTHRTSQGPRCGRIGSHLQKNRRGIRAQFIWLATTSSSSLLSTPRKDIFSTLKKLLVYVLTSNNSGLAAWWGLMSTSTVEPTAHGSIPGKRSKKS